MTITNVWNVRPSKFDESQHTSTFASRLPTASFNKVKIGEVYDQSLRDKLRQMKVDVFGLLVREFSVERCVPFLRFWKNPWFPSLTHNSTMEYGIS